MSDVPGVRYFRHPARPHWGPIRWTNPTEPQVQGLLDDGYEEMTPEEIRAWKAERDETRPPAA